jgi:ATP-dependent Zn protease
MGCCLACHGVGNGQQPGGEAVRGGEQVLGPDADEWSETRQQLAAYIDVAMGGRVAEELTFGADQARAQQTQQASNLGRSAA